MTTTTTRTTQVAQSDALSVAVVRYSRDWPHLLNHTHKSKTLHARLLHVCVLAQTAERGFLFWLVFCNFVVRAHIGTVLLLLYRVLLKICMFFASRGKWMNAIPRSIYTSRKTYVNIRIHMCDSMSPSGYVTEQQQGTHNDGVRSRYTSAQADSVGRYTYLPTYLQYVSRM